MVTWTIIHKGKQQLELDKFATVADLKKSFASQYGYPAERQRFTYDAKDGPKPLVDDAVKLIDLNIGGNTLKFKDLGPQIAWKTVFLVEYFGPIVLYFFFFARPQLIYGPSTAPVSLVQSLACFLWIFHYVKRELETLFVHRFSAETMPLRNLFKNCAHYWLAAIYIGYPVNKPDFEASTTETVIWFATAFFLICEAGNLISHLQLRNLRKEGTKDRGIPRGGLFEFVSCPNYTYEIGAWLAFAVLTQSWAAILFLIFGAGQMIVWAQKKHNRYRKEFPSYPQQRKIIFPFVY